MIREIKKGNKAPYKGYLIGMKEYQEYQKLKEIIPQTIETIKELRDDDHDRRIH